MSIDLFKTRTMLAALEQMKPPKSFLLDTFFKGTEQSTTEYIDIDVFKGKRRMAVFVKPTSQGKVIDRPGYTTNTYKPPYIKMKMPTTAADMFKREMGNTIYQGNSAPAARAAAQLGKDLTELWQLCRRREEWMAAQLLNSGAMTLTGDGINDTIDFGMASSHKVTLTGGDLWTDAASTPLDDLRHWRTQVSQDCGLVPNVAILGSSVVDAFLNNSQIKTILDNRRIVQGAIDVQSLQENGVTYLGSLFGGGLDIMSYDEWYLDDAGVEQPMVPVDKVWLGSTNARATKHYAAIQDLKASAAVPYFPKSWEEEDPSLRMLLLQSAPMHSLHQVDAFMSIKAV